jgi:hypothetical protein
MPHLYSKNTAKTMILHFLMDSAKSGTFPLQTASQNNNINMDWDKTIHPLTNKDTPVNPTFVT